MTTRSFCDEFERKLEPYLAGSLTDSESEAIEAHAAQCATCERRLELASRVPVAATSFVPPAGLREATLAAVARRRQQQRTVRWMGTVTALAAVLVLAVAVRTYFGSRGNGESGPPPVATLTPTVPTSPVPAPADTPHVRAATTPTVAPDSPTVRHSATPPSVVATSPAPPTNTAVPPVTKVARVFISDPDRFAAERSSTEFAELDAAARELEAALARSPDDEQLRSFLATVLARRDELTRRVKAAHS